MHQANTNASTPLRAGSSIARVDTLPLVYEEPHAFGTSRSVAVVRIEDSDGAVGWGEAVCGAAEAALAVRTIVAEGYAPLLLGADPSSIRALWHRLRDRGFWYGQGGIASLALAGVDTALWDLAGRRLGVPVHQLLGGKLHDRVRASAAVMWDTRDVDGPARQSADYVARGFTATKGGWGHPDREFGLEPDRDVELVRRVREAVGDAVDVAVDVSGRANWSPAHAIGMARRFGDYELAWLEDALHHEDYEGLRRLRAAAPMAIATGEREWTPAGYRRLVESQGVDLVLVDPGRVDGITGMRLVVEHAAANGLRFVPHSWTTAINTAASLQVLAASTNGVLLELKPDPSPLQAELVATPIEQVDGWVAVPDAPGLGIEVDEAVLRRYTVGS
jgi:L-alanine-DL-glutamate epimerase-like enolase superfamily enzyme